MKKIYIVLLLSFLFSCQNRKTIQLPEINNAQITEVLDISPAYIFYDETKKDSLELNRKNLISTTNWLVNVDKRLTLKQVIPTITFLQEKKRNAKMHKNEAAKNYYTCSDTNIKNLGFLEFTNINYHESKKDTLNKFHSLWEKEKLEIYVKSKKSIHLIGTSLSTAIMETNFENFASILKKLNRNDSLQLFLNFNKKLTFQEYISIKSIVQEFAINKISINNNEFIY
ncbi:MAG: hypothetical protein ACPG6B_05795 [Oceanihabitans sp.]